MTVDLKIPRDCFIQDFTGAPGQCPRCDSPLTQQFATYLIATRRGKQATDSFIMSSDFGWYCEKCPTVVINARLVDDMLGSGLAHWKTGNEWAVLGTVDLDAVPPNKRDVLLGEDDNPIPLVEFTTQPTHQAKTPLLLTKPPSKKKKKAL